MTKINGNLINLFVDNLIFVNNYLKYYIIYIFNLNYMLFVLYYWLNIRELGAFIYLFIYLFILQKHDS